MLFRRKSRKQIPPEKKERRGYSMRVRLFGGFSAVLILSVVAATFGYIGFHAVKKHMAEEDRVNALVTRIYETRQHEKDFLLSGEKAAADAVVAGVTALAGADGDDGTGKGSQAMVTRALEATGAYRSAFEDYVALAQERKATMADMEVRAGEAMTMAEEIGRLQRDRMTSYQAASVQQLKERITNANDANQIIASFLEARIGEKEFIATGGDPMWRRKAAAGMTKTRQQAEALRGRDSMQDHAAEMDGMIAALDAYTAAFETLSQGLESAMMAVADMEAQSAALIKLSDDTYKGLKVDITMMQSRMEYSRGELDLFFGQKMGNFLRMNENLQMFSEIRQNEKAFDRAEDKGSTRDGIVRELETLTLRVGMMKRQMKEGGDERYQKWFTEQISQLVDTLKAYRKSFETYADILIRQDDLKKEMTQKAELALQACALIGYGQTEALMSAQVRNLDLLEDRLAKSTDAGDIIRQFMEGRLFEKQFVISNGAPRWKTAAAERISRITAMAKDLSGRFDTEEEKKQIAEILQRVDAYGQSLNRFDQLIASQKEASTQMTAAAEGAQNAGRDALGRQRASLFSQIERAEMRMAAALGIVVLVGILLSLGITRGITGPLNRMMGRMTGASDRVLNSAVRISDASRSLAEGASQQAASIEETSASLEEMASMTRQNADHAHAATDLVKQSDRLAGDTQRRMSDLSAAMAGISKASDETGRIIKSIDEIAFQTNLLALNAAVEAARAGEAGAGFAVVADEVRNLALRAAEAARNTTALIENTVKEIQNGTVLVNDAETAVHSIAENVSKITQLVEQIDAASNEQAEGIAQVNRAASEMEKVTQQAATGAEDSAAASGELKTQADGMKEMVRNLERLVWGAGRKRNMEKTLPPSARQLADSGTSRSGAPRLPGNTRQITAG